MRTDSARAIRFGELVRERREAAGLSLAQLAEAIGLAPGSGGYLGRIERGENDPALSRALAIAELLGIDMEDLDGTDQEGQ